MKIVFLDVDGVLNSAAWMHHQFEKGNKWGRGSDPYERDSTEIDPATIILLNQIVERVPDVKFVLSSTWRLIKEYRNGVGLQRMLKEYFDFRGSIIDVTPRFSRRHQRGLLDERGCEIQDWLEDHPGVEKFVILDDDSDMGDLIDHLVQTSNDTGLEQSHVDEVVRRLS